MFTQIISACLMLSTFSVWSMQTVFPQHIDYGTFESTIENEIYEEISWSLGYDAFNYAPELTPFFAMLMKKYEIRVAVETGTYRGNTAALFALLFEQVETIEVTPAQYFETRTKLARFPNVHCHLGSSEVVLNEILPQFERVAALFYLDAHWYNNWPLLQELEVISKTHKDNCIVVIDDFKVPGRDDVLYDQYGEHACSYEYVKEQLGNVFTSYTYYYLIPKNVASKAKFVAIPDHWNSL